MTEAPTQIIRPPIHVMVSGMYGSGKSTFLSTFPKPMLVKVFDPPGKDMPYMVKQRGMEGEVKVGELQTWETYNITYRDIVHPDGVIRLEYYHCSENYSAFSSYEAIQDGFDWRPWKTLGVDSATFMELAARKHDEYVMNPNTKDPRQWYARSALAMEHQVMVKLSGLPINLVLLTHFDEQLDERWGELVKRPAVGGKKLPPKVGAAFGEAYVMYGKKDEKGEVQRILQTSSADGYACQTQINAPPYCYPHYTNLWTNWGR